MDKINVLGINFDNVSLLEGVSYCNGFLQGEKLEMVVTPNPEIVMQARKDKQFKNIINNASLVVPDGIGIIYGSKILKTPLKERVAGFDLICGFFEDTMIKDKKVYLLGAAPGVAEKAKENLEKSYNIKVVGVHDGYFKKEECNDIIDKINKSDANILLVGLGMKKQEEFIYNYKERLKVKVAFGCGGSLDVFAGNVKRAPKVFRNAGLEWLYRLAQQPSRLGRMMQLPKFLLVVKFEGNKNNEIE